MTQAQMRVRAPDGVVLDVRQRGNRAGPGILFVHGLFCGQRYFDRQMHSALAEEFHLVSFDLRGHGLSDKPSDPRGYSVRQWAGDLQVVLAATGLIDPLLVGWSLGGVVIAYWLAFHGDSRIAGMNLVASPMIYDPSTEPPKAPGDAAGMLGAAPEMNLPAASSFVRSCTAMAPPPEESAALLSVTLSASREVRRSILDSLVPIPPPGPGGISITQSRTPKLITWGSEDSLTPLARGRYVAENLPRAELSIYEGVGHSPFLEAPERFNAELAAFVRRSRKLRPGAHSHD